MPIVCNLYRYKKGYVFSEVMFNQLRLKTKVLQGAQVSRGINFIKISCCYPQRSNNLDRK